MSETLIEGLKTVIEGELNRLAVHMKTLDEKGDKHGLSLACSYVKGIERAADLFLALLKLLEKEQSCDTN